MGALLTTTLFGLPMLLIGVVLRHWHVSATHAAAVHVLTNLDEADEASTSRTIPKKVSSQKTSLSLAQKVFLLFAFGLGCSVQAIINSSVSIGTVFVGGSTLSIGYLLVQRRKRSEEEQRLEDLEFFLPSVMERIVMAVQAGLDIIPSLEAVCAITKSEADEREDTIDAVTVLLGEVLRLHGSGVPLERALEEVAEQVPSTAIRHAFIHLALAHRDGGELVMPLRELSDATQLYYQESVENRIAKLPVKATLPLLLTFAGLLLLFLTTPMVQVLELTKQIPKH